mgnify:CR=1 FL=1
MPIAINGSGTVTGISVGGLPDGIVDTDMIAAAAVTAPKRGAGAILQVLQSTKTDTASRHDTAYGDTGLSQAITTTGSNKVLVRLFIQWGVEAGHAVSFRLARTTGGTTTNTLFLGDDANSRDRVTLGGLAANAPWEVNTGSMEFLDSPGAGTHTYKLQWQTPSGATVAYFNRSFRDNDAAGEARTPSAITVMEVAV